MRSVVADDVRVDGDGLHLSWTSGGPERDHAGAFVAFSDVQDADTEEAPPEVRLRDGRTLFVTAMARDVLAGGLAAAGIEDVRRAPVWGWLLEPFLDTDYAIMRERVEGELASWGFDAPEVAEIRARVREPMLTRAAVTLEWAHFGQADVIDACCLVEKVEPFEPFRRWTDEIAARGPRIERWRAAE